MQDRYAGDIGDYGKFAMLRAMEEHGLKLGINWYRTETASFEIHEDGKYRIPTLYEKCDLQLATALNSIFDSAEDRSVRKLEQADLLKCKRFVHNLVPRDIRLRTDWHRQALSYFKNCDLVFLDPDNGLNVKSVKAGSQKSPKYVWIDEITDFVAAGKSVIFYNHRPRKKADTYFAEYFARFAAEPVLSEKTVYALTFPRRSVRDYFVIPATPAHEEKICAALHVLEAGEFGKSGFCTVAAVKSVGK